MTSPFAIVLGPNSTVGPHLCQYLAQAGFIGQCHSRRPLSPLVAWPNEFSWQQLDLVRPQKWQAQSQAIVFSLVPLPLLCRVLPRLRKVRHIVALGSTSLFAKANSSNAKEQMAVQQWQQAEAAFIAFCQEQAVTWTILRPTLIYDPGRDINITAMARFMKQYRIIPLAWPAQGLRQPIFAGDVARAAVLAYQQVTAHNLAFNLCGGETLAYRDMVRRIFHALGQPALFFSSATNVAKIFFPNCQSDTAYTLHARVYYPHESTSCF